MGGGGVSYIKIMQRIGRGMRIMKDKKGNIIKSEVHIHDFFDKTSKILERHSKDRIKIAKQAKYEIVYED